MQIISHRGYWKYDAEKNTSNAFTRSFSLGLGTETDVRDFNGKLVISHNMATKNSLPAEKFFLLYNSIHKKHKIRSPLALNIKADGIRDILKQLLKKYGIKEYFVFDMSVPEQIQYVKQGFKTFTRQSEFEKNPSLYKESIGVWIDCFKNEWYTEKILSQHLKDGKIVCLVSPELHKRNHMNLWKKLSKMKIVHDKKWNNKLILCTDIPEEARRYFHEKN